MKRIILLAHLEVRRPGWWPEGPVTVDREGGWSAGVDRALAFPAKYLKEAKTIWRETYPPRRWKVRFEVLEA